MQLLTLMFILDLADPSETGYVSLGTSAACTLAFLLLIAYQWRNRIVNTKTAVSAWVSDEPFAPVGLALTSLSQGWLSLALANQVAMQANWSQLTQQSKLKEEHCAVVIQAQWRGFVARKQLHAHKEKLSGLVGRQSRLAAKATKGLRESRSGSKSPVEDNGGGAGGGELEVDTVENPIDAEAA